jgi:hypothetical protein
MGKKTGKCQKKHHHKPDRAQNFADSFLVSGKDRIGLVFHDSIKYTKSICFFIIVYFAGKIRGMSSGMIVDSSSQLQELRGQSPVIRLVAKIISYIFHPVFVPVYIILFLLYIHPVVFAGFSSFKKTIVLLQALLPYIVLPVVTVLLLKALNFIDTITLTTRKDRIIPYIACNLWYFWIGYVWYNQIGYPKEIIILAIAIFISSVIGQLANIYMKISIHAIAMGVTIAFMVFLSIIQPVNFGIYISTALLATGMVCSARFVVSDHAPKEIYGGLLAGIAALLLAIVFV